MNPKHKLAEIERIAADILATARADGYDGPVGLINILNSVKIYDQAASDYLDWGGTFREFQYRLVKTALFCDTPYTAYMAHGYHTGFKYSFIVNYTRSILKEYGLDINPDYYLIQNGGMKLVCDIIQGYDGKTKDDLVWDISFEYFD